MSRLLLNVTSIRAEPLRDISDTDAMREGIYSSFLRDTPVPIAMDCNGNEKVLVAGVPKRDFEALWRGLYPEVQEAIEKQNPKKPKKDIVHYRCPNCDAMLNTYETCNCCNHCGQKLDWSDYE